jgi:hypothetical protein
VLCKPPLVLACVSCRTNESFLATVHNLCEEGLYVETYFPVRTDDHILIHPKRSLPAGMPGGLLEENVGVVVWSGPVNRNGHPFQGAGIRFLAS